MFKPSKIATWWILPEKNPCPRRGLRTFEGSMNPSWQTLHHSCSQKFELASRSLATFAACRFLYTDRPWIGARHSSIWSSFSSLLTFSELEGSAADIGVMGAADSESSGEGHHRRGRTSNTNRHRTTSISPPNRSLKRSRSPSFDKYRDRKASRKHGRHGDREDRDRKGGTQRKLNALSETNGEREEEEVIKGAHPEAEGDGEGEREPIRVRRTHSESRKSEKPDVAGDYSSEESEGEEVSESERRRKKRRADRHGEKKSKRRHRPVESDSEVSETEGTSAESSEDSEDERRRAKRRKRRKQKERDEWERDKEDDRRRKEKVLFHWC